MIRKLLSTSPLAFDLGILLLRLSTGFLLMTHGWQKFQGFSEQSGDFPDPIGFGSPAALGLTIFGELVCAFLVAIGLFSRFALIVIIIMMLIIAFKIHGPDPLADKEHALLFLFPFLTIFFTGPGRYSVDAALKR